MRRRYSTKDVLADGALLLHARPTCCGLRTGRFDRPRFVHLSLNKCWGAKPWGGGQTPARRAARFTAMCLAVRRSQEAAVSQRSVPFPRPSTCVWYSGRDGLTHVSCSVARNCPRWGLAPVRAGTARGRRSSEGRSSVNSPASLATAVASRKRLRSPVPAGKPEPAGEVEAIHRRAAGRVHFA